MENGKEMFWLKSQEAPSLTASELEDGESGGNGMQFLTKTNIHLGYTSPLTTEN